MATYSIGDLSRRELLKMSAILGVTSAVSTKFAFAQAALPRTPGQILGPFYPMKPFDQNADLTKVSGRQGRAEGEILNVMGRVLNLKGELASIVAERGDRCRSGGLSQRHSPHLAQPDQESGGCPPH